MATNFPGSLDSYTNPVGSDLLSTGAGGDSHSTMHSNLNDAVEALEAKVGANSSDVTTSHDYKIDALETDVSGATNLNTASKIVKRDASGNFSAGTITAALTGNVTGNVTGDVTGDVTGNADTATALATSRTIELTGDVTGSASFDGSANASIAATVAANSVALGTDTTGNYVATVSAGTGISVSGVGSETATASIALKAAYAKASVTTNGDGDASIAHGLGSNSANAAVFVTPREELSDDSDLMLTCVVTSVDSTNINIRAYEFDGSATGTSGATISSVYNASFDVSWFAIY